MFPMSLTEHIFENATVPTRLNRFLDIFGFCRGVESSCRCVARYELHTFNTDDKLPTDLIVDITFFLRVRLCRSKVVQKVVTESRRHQGRACQAFEARLCHGCAQSGN